MGLTEGLGVFVGVLILVVAYVLAGSDRRARRAYDIGRTVGYAAGRAEAWLESMREKA